MRANRVLTRPRGWAVLVAVVIAVAVPLVGGTLGGAQTLSFTLTVKKVVTGVVPPGTTFTVSVQCVGVDPAAAGSTSTTATTAPVHAASNPVPVVITFDAQGNPTTANTIPVTVGSTCTATETVTGGAQSVSYGCATTNATEVACVSSQQVRVIPDDNVGAAATITVTNAFPTPPVVIVAPTFTG